MRKLSSFTVTAPGRVFLFGEHSDYFNLQVISAALNYSIYAKVEERADNQIKINYRDLKVVDSFRINEELNYRHKRDYLRSAYNILKRKGIMPSTGANINISGTIPIAAGLSSSSALAVASVMVFSRLSNHEFTKREISELAFEAEVLEFGESGGMMDHIASIYGGIIHVDFNQNAKLTELALDIPGLIIGDSLEKKKDTVGDIKMIKSTVEKGFSILSDNIPNFHRSTTSYEIIEEVLDKLPEESKTMTEATLTNRDLTKRALVYLLKGDIDEAKFSEMINQHHLILRDGLKRSTPKLEKLIKASLTAGALGAKMNGSGGGGTMLAYAPGREREVAKAISKAGGKAYSIAISKGASIE